MHRTHVHLTEQQVQGLAKMSQAGGLSTAEIIRRAVDAYLCGVVHGIQIRHQDPDRVAATFLEHLGRAKEAGICTLAPRDERDHSENDE